MPKSRIMTEKLFKLLKSRLGLDRLRCRICGHPIQIGERFVAKNGWSGKRKYYHSICLKAVEV